MRDNEIIKVEKVIKNLHAYCFCSQSVFKKMGYNFTEADFDYLYNLIYIIKKQNEEIETLKKELMKCKLEKEIIYNLGMEIKFEAIKEFAEELEYFVLNEDIEVVKPKCKDYESYINGANQFRHQIKNGINNLVKEMTEKNNDFKEV